MMLYEVQKCRIQGLLRTCIVMGIGLFLDILSYAAKDRSSPPIRLCYRCSSQEMTAGSLEIA